MAKIAYRHISFTRGSIRDNDRRERGWRRDGTSFVVLDKDGTTRHEQILHAAEGSYENPTQQSRQAFLGYLNGRSSEGWTVMSFSTGEFEHWPLGHFLLAKES